MVNQTQLKKWNVLANEVFVYIWSHITKSINTLFEDYAISQTFPYLTALVSKYVHFLTNKMVGSRRINPGAEFLRIFTVAFD